jgi:3-aminobutyryl-CoA ammonia-lyase
MNTVVSQESTTNTPLPMASIETRVDSHYPDGVISLGIIMELFGMAGGKLSIMMDGDTGLARAFENVEFLAPAFQGDYLRVDCKLISVGRTSRKRSYEAWVVARQHGVGDLPSHGDILAKPILVARATGTAVVPLTHQRKPGTRRQVT